MIIVTLHEISVFRKAYLNSNNDIEYKRPTVIFYGITRQNAEENLKGLIKYLFNYGFYKFGFEVSAKSDKIHNFIILLISLFFT